MTGIFHSDKIYDSNNIVSYWCVYFPLHFMEESVVENLAEDILIWYGFWYIIFQYDCVYIFTYYFTDVGIVNNLSYQKVGPTIPWSVNSILLNSLSIWTFFFSKSVITLSLRGTYLDACYYFNLKLVYSAIKIRQEGF